MIKISFLFFQESHKSNVLKSEREQELVNKIAKLQEELTNLMGQNLVLKNNQVSKLTSQVFDFRL
jgi:hypothetical protein